MAASPAARRPRVSEQSALARSPDCLDSCPVPRLLRILRSSHVRQTMLAPARVIKVLGVSACERAGTSAHLAAQQRMRVEH
eukprot:7061516-Prymnesium_polylepis.2